VRDCDQNLGERLRNAERFSADMDRQLMAGEEVLHRLVRIVGASRGEPAEVVEQDVPAAPSPPDPHAMVAAAQAFAVRARSRLGGRAA